VKILTNAMRWGISAPSAAITCQAALGNRAHQLEETYSTEQ
jgi:hypothetical protein